MADTRAAQPVAPDPAYRRTILDRHGPDAVYVIRGAVWSLPALVIGVLLGGFAAGQLGLTGGYAIAFVLAATAIVGPGTLLLALTITNTVAAGVGAAVWPSGASTPYEEQFSAEEALLARGQVSEALDAFTSRLAEHPSHARLHLRVADVWCREGRDPRRAAALYRAVQRMPAAPAGDDIYATSRLVDLYRGPLGEPGRALVELRRLAERHPHTPAGAHAREAIGRLKAEFASADSDTAADATR